MDGGIVIYGSTQHELDLFARRAPELPTMSLLGDELIAGDVVSVEPGSCRLGFGGCRLEDSSS